MLRRTHPTLYLFILLIALHSSIARSELTLARLQEIGDREATDADTLSLVLSFLTASQRNLDAFVGRGVVTDREMIATITTQNDSRYNITLLLGRAMPVVFTVTSVRVEYLLEDVMGRTPRNLAVNGTCAFGGFSFEFYLSSVGIQITVPRMTEAERLAEECNCTAEKRASELTRINTAMVQAIGVYCRANVWACQGYVSNTAGSVFELATTVCTLGGYNLGQYLFDAPSAEKALGMNVRCGDVSAGVLALARSYLTGSFACYRMGSVVVVRNRTDSVSSIGNHQFPVILPLSFGAVSRLSTADGTTGTSIDATREAALSPQVLYSYDPWTDGSTTRYNGLGNWSSRWVYGITGTAMPGPCPLPAAPAPVVAPAVR